jgi:hypothetical protein
MILVKLNIVTEVNISESIYSEYCHPAEGSIIFSVCHIVNIIWRDNDDQIPFLKILFLQKQQYQTLWHYAHIQHPPNQQKVKGIVQAILAQLQPAVLPWSNLGRREKVQAKGKKVVSFQ